jgi:hypothetical protein
MLLEGRGRRPMRSRFQALGTPSKVESGNGIRHRNIMNYYESKNGKALIHNTLRRVCDTWYGKPVLIVKEMGKDKRLIMREKRVSLHVSTWAQQPPSLSWQPQPLTIYTHNTPHPYEAREDHLLPTQSDTAGIHPHPYFSASVPYGNLPSLRHQTTTESMHPITPPKVQRKRAQSHYTYHHP